MVVLSLECAVDGQAEISFNVTIDSSAKVSELKQAVKHWSDGIITSPAPSLKLFLAKKGNGWLPSKEFVAIQEADTLVDFERVPWTDGSWSIQEMLAEVRMPMPETKQIHVLVQVPSGINMTIGGDGDANSIPELEHYQLRGKEIQQNCSEYYKGILDKIDSLYALRTTNTLPFICVEASSGMGKTQLAFSLGGRRPWFYWPATSVGDDSQSVYKNFKSISRAFDRVTRKDNLAGTRESRILDPKSDFFAEESLWTYGFILALLEYSSSENKGATEMVLFDKTQSVHVDKCDLNTIVAFRKKVEAQGKSLPFFVLDEMSPNTHQDGGGQQLAAFQRDVFRACGLVVIVMGTDATITNVVYQSGGGYKEENAWMTLVSRFPPYQAMISRMKRKTLLGLGFKHSIRF